MNIELVDLAATERCGRKLGAALFPGAVIALNGPLGAGKTHFVRAVAEGLEIANPAVVTSPTFVLIQEYAARLPIYHFDVYRLKSADEFRDLGIDEYFSSDGVCLIEWAEKFAECLPADHLSITLRSEGDQRRWLTVQSHGPEHSALLRSFS